jgi:hypothetical protein
MPKMRQTVAFMAPLSTRSWTRYPWRIFRGPAPERSQFVRLCYKSWPFVSSGQGSEGGHMAAQDGLQIANSAKEGSSDRMSQLRRI